MFLLKSVPTEIRILILLLILSLFFHLYNFSDRLNFSTDQGKFSLKALELFQSREISLIGPSISFNLEGREIYQGGVIYYFLLIFLLLGNFEPVTSSLLFAIFSVLMSIPLYIGLRNILGREKSILGTGLYLLSPIFINYTNFLWNPNFQLSLMPILFLLLGFYKKTQKSIFLIVSGVWLGILFQFHYQLFIGLILIIFWLRFYFKVFFPKLLLFFAGFILGLSPMIIFELRNNFYNLNTAIFFLKNFSKLGQSGGNLLAQQHYFLSLLLLVLVMILSWVKKVPTKILFLVLGLLIVWDSIIYLPRSTQGFGMADNWQYKDEEKVSQIVKAQNSDNYNFTNLEYDSLYFVQKFLNAKNGNSDRVKDYWEMNKLFAVIKNNEDLDKDPAYEIQVIKPYKILNMWEINSTYNLYLLEKSSTAN